MIKTIDEDLKLEIAYNPKYKDRIPVDKITILFVPGMGTMGRFSRKMLRVKNFFERRGLDMNIAHFVYKSHQQNTISDLENDVYDIEKAVNSLEKFEIPREKIGLCGLCYGSYVISKYLNQDNNIKFAIFFDPYLGINSFTKSTRITLNTIGKGIKKMINLFGIKKIYIGNRYTNNPGYLDLNSFWDNVCNDIILKRRDIPILGINTGYHSFIDRNVVERFFKKNNFEYYFISEMCINNKINKIVQCNIYNTIARFIKKNI
ncbi:MAG: hypothetical protein QXG00_01650 [Candidatus Woesearchaeota archaeon]